MLRFNRWQIIGLIALVVLAAYVTLPNFTNREEPLPGLPDTGVTLGLDLQGGSYLLLEVDTDFVVDARVDNLRGEIRREFRRSPRLRVSGIDREGDAIAMRIPEGEDFEAAEQRLRRLSRPLGVGVPGRDTRVTADADARRLSIELTEEAKAFYASSAVDESITAVRLRIDNLGTVEPSIQRQG
ncbi:MAG: hypothetical protein V2I43_22365, partial [Parvularcula sp.]|nr:hypothetical protein [Parvularcula sp.]